MEDGEAGLTALTFHPNYKVRISILSTSSHARTHTRTQHIRKHCSLVK